MANLTLTYSLTPGPEEVWPHLVTDRRLLNAAVDGVKILSRVAVETKENKVTDPYKHAQYGRQGHLLSANFRRAWRLSMALNYITSRMMISLWQPALLHLFVDLRSPYTFPHVQASSGTTKIRVSRSSGPKSDLAIVESDRLSEHPNVNDYGADTVPFPSRTFL